MPKTTQKTEKGTSFPSQEDSTIQQIVNKNANQNVEPNLNLALRNSQNLPVIDAEIGAIIDIVNKEKIQKKHPKKQQKGVKNYD